MRTWANRYRLVVICAFQMDSQDVRTITCMPNSYKESKSNMQNKVLYIIGASLLLLLKNTEVPKLPHK